MDYKTAEASRSAWCSKLMTLCTLTLTVPKTVTIALPVKIYRLPVEIWDQLIFLMAHTGPEMCDANIGLLGPAQIRLWNQHVAH